MERHQLTLHGVCCGVAVRFVHSADDVLLLSWSQALCVHLGRIFQFVHGEEDVGMPPLINPQNLPGVVKTLLESTRDEPHIAEQICFALSQLAAGFKDSDTSLFSPYFADIVQALLQQVISFYTICLAVTQKLVYPFFVCHQITMVFSRMCT